MKCKIAGSWLVLGVLALSGCGGVEGQPDDDAGGDVADDASGEAAPDAADADADADEDEGTGADADADADADGDEGTGADADADGDVPDGAEAEVVDGTTHVCGNLVVEAPWEECDDGNPIAGDGCESDCRYSCHAVTDCPDDGNPCTTEDCLAGGTGQICQSFSNRLDCNDGNPCTVEDRCADGDCQGTRLPTWWRDADDDGHGDPHGETTCAVEPPEGYVGSSDDCCDADGLVFPGQTDWFTHVSTLCTVAGGAPYWDYDCSGIVQRERTGCGSCTPDSSSGTCITSVGWQVSGDACEVACGLFWNWINSCSMPGCLPQILSIQQRCH
jgi:cysteine-rich repeat protein